MGEVVDEVVARVLAVAWAGLRSFIQGLWAGVVTWLTSLGIVLTESQTAAVEIALGALVFGAVVAGIRFLETVRGDAPWQRAARKVGAVLMLGTSRLQPTYGPKQIDGEVTTSTTAPLR